MTINVLNFGGQIVRRPHSRRRPGFDPSENLIGMGTHCFRYILTVWTFQDFSVTQILREINFRESRRSKFAVFVIVEDLNFVI